MPSFADLSLYILSHFFHLIQRLLWWHMYVVLTVASHYREMTIAFFKQAHTVERATAVINGRVVDCRSRPVYIYYSRVPVNVRKVCLHICSCVNVAWKLVLAKVRICC